MKLLLIEDDQRAARFVQRGFSEHGHVVDHATNGKDGLFLAASEKYDALIVDRMLPTFDGLTLVKTLRGAGHHTPVLFLTAMDGIDDRVEGLESGGDDYLAKPLAFSELLARIGAILRRPPVSDVKTILGFADLELNLMTRKVTRAGQNLKLLPQEFRLLEYLLRNEGRTVTRTMLLEHVWGFHFDP